MFVQLEFVVQAFKGNALLHDRLESCHIPGPVAMGELLQLLQAFIISLAISKSASRRPQRSLRVIVSTRAISLIDKLLTSAATSTCGKSWTFVSAINSSHAATACGTACGMSRGSEMGRLMAQWVAQSRSCPRKDRPRPVNPKGQHVSAVSADRSGTRPHSALMMLPDASIKASSKKPVRAKMLPSRSSATTTYSERPKHCTPQSRHETPPTP